jgi:hypothetical protein
MAIQRTIVLPVEPHWALEATLEEAHKAYRVISRLAFESKTYARYTLQMLSYRCGEFQRGYLESPEWTIQAAKLLCKRRRRDYRYELHVTVIRDEPQRG